jgi:UDP-N-acetylmuramate dehydrogenase
MNLRMNVSLSEYSTMRLGGLAAHVAEINGEEDLLEALQWAEVHNLPVIMVGGGSNIYWRDDGFPGLVLVNKVMGYDDEPQEYGSHHVTMGAGENWDDAVARTVDAGLTGIEALSLVPGTVGGTPIQNVGAYGQEISQTLIHVEAYDNRLKQFVTITGNECGFGYRASRFKSGPDKGRFFIIRIKLRLQHGNPSPPFYSALQKYFDEHDIHEYTPKIVRDAVIAIRSSKLPSPAEFANNGSFFANPVIDSEAFSKLSSGYPDVPHWVVEGGRTKLPAAWLIDQAGFKNYHDAETGMATWPAQSLVLINEHARSTADLEKFKQKIIGAVHQKFGITLQQEPELLP